MILLRFHFHWWWMHSKVVSEQFAASCHGHLHALDDIHFLSLLQILLMHTQRNNGIVDPSKTKLSKVGSHTNHYDQNRPPRYAKFAVACM